MTFIEEISEKILFLLKEKGKKKRISSTLDFNKIHIIYDIYPQFLTVFSDLDIVLQILGDEVITFIEGNWIDQINNYYREAFRDAKIKSIHSVK
ncbi:hypothetical protein ES703_105661 [subsurface metagenome]